MKNITISKKTKTIVSIVFAVIIFSLGAYMRPGIDLGVEVGTALFSSKQKYEAPVSEYDTLVNQLWKSPAHQSVCKANAAATVALQLARKYLDEGEKQSALSNYDQPLSVAVEKQQEYGKR